VEAGEDEQFHRMLCLIGSKRARPQVLNHDNRIAVLRNAGVVREQTQWHGDGLRGGRCGCRAAASLGFPGEQRGDRGFIISVDRVGDDELAFGDPPIRLPVWAGLIATNFAAGRPLRAMMITFSAPDSTAPTSRKRVDLASSMLTVGMGGLTWPDQIKPGAFGGKFKRRHRAGSTEGDMRHMFRHMPSKSPRHPERHVRLFKNGRNQAVRIPREFELPGDEAVVRKEGERLIIEPAPARSLLALLATLMPLDEDFPPIPDAPPDAVES
jgi:antitoxin VapB